MAYSSASLFVLCLTVVCAQQHDMHDAHNHHFHTVAVDVYYESLCPDSIKFFTSQLYPSLQGNLSNHVNLTLIPYGKSTHTFKDNSYTFVCHHGPNECAGNKIQACALNLINGGNNTEDLGFNRNTVGFINCLLDKVNRTAEPVVFPTNECAIINNVTNLVNIQNCAAHTDASTLLANLGTKTQALRPALSSVPTIVFNNEFIKEDNALAQTNFVQALCKYIVHDKPSECTANSATMLQLSSIVAPLVLLNAYRHF